MNDNEGRKALLLVGKRARFQPSVQRWFTTGEFGDIMCSAKRFGIGNRHFHFRTFASPDSQGALRRNSSSISGAVRAGLDRASIKALKPAGLNRIGAVSISTSSAARTAASRTKSVRERPRRIAARAIMARSASGSRIERGRSLRLTTRGIGGLQGNGFSRL